MLNFNFPEKDLGLVSPSHFVYDFSRKIFLMLHSIIRPNFFVWLPLLLQILGNMCITIVCQPGCDVIKFENNLLIYQAVLLHDYKVKTKTEISSERKELFRWHKKHFSSILKDFQLPKIISALTVRL